jgi:hypothetical protein
MTGLPKLVVSRTLGEATWANTQLVSGDTATELSPEREESPGYEASCC